MLPYKINKELLLKDEEFLVYQHKQFERIINNLCVEIKIDSYVVGGYETAAKVNIHREEELNYLIYLYGDKAIKEIEKTKQELGQYNLYLSGKEVDKITALYFALSKGWINASNNTNIFIPPLN